MDLSGTANLLSKVKQNKYGEESTGDDLKEKKIEDQYMRKDCESGIHKATNWFFVSDRNNLLSMFKTVEKQKKYNTHSNPAGSSRIIAFI